MDLSVGVGPPRADENPTRAARRCRGSGRASATLGSMMLLLLAACSGGSDKDSGAAEACTSGPATTLNGPWFTDVTASALDPDLTYGFGRPTVVDLDADGFDDIVATRAHDGTHGEDPFAKLVLRNQGDGTFVDWTAESGLADARLGLLVFGDLDEDGDPDLFGGTISGVGVDQAGIWWNEGGRLTHDPATGYAVEQVACGDLTCTEVQITASFLDLDEDGDLDLYTGAWFWSDAETDTRYNPPPRDKLWENLGDGTFDERTGRLGDQSHPLSETSDSFGRAAMGVAPGDYDNDGDLDLFVANYGVGRPVGPAPDEPLCEPPRYWDQDLLWRNDEAWQFANVADEAGVAATVRGPEAIQEEEPLVIGAECGLDPAVTYPGPIGGNGFTPEFADFDNDGDLDLIVGQIAHADYVQSDRTLLFVNRGDGTFSEESQERGLSWREDEKHPSWVDIDHDGRLDLAITGFRDEEVNWLAVYHQDESGQFTFLGPDETGLDDHHQEGLVWIDYDNDGDLDAYVAEDAENAKLYRNDYANVNNWLAVRLVGGRPADGTGARIEVDGPTGTQLREITSGNGHYNPQVTKTAYFGLGGDTCASDVRVRWADGEVSSLGETAGGQIVVVER